MKYEPQKVFILENGKYEELTYQEFFDHFESDGIYPKKYFIPLYGMLLEVDRIHTGSFIDLNAGRNI